MVPRGGETFGQRHVRPNIAFRTDRRDRDSHRRCIGVTRYREQCTVKRKETLLSSVAVKVKPTKYATPQPASRSSTISRYSARVAPPRNHRFEPPVAKC